MAKAFPSTQVIQDRLKGLSHAQLQRLAALSGVPFTTIWKIRINDTKNPGLETVRKFWQHVEAVEKERV
jgi:hypothetical protein